MSENAARAVFRVTGECLTASKSIEGFAHSDPESWRRPCLVQGLQPFGTCWPVISSANETIPSARRS